MVPKMLIFFFFFPRPCYFFNVRLCGIDVLIGLLCILRCTLCFSPFPLKALFTLVCKTKRKMKRKRLFSAQLSEAIAQMKYEEVLLFSA